jgi:hypothetical protein
MNEKTTDVWSNAIENLQTKSVSSCEQCTNLFQDPMLVDVKRTWSHIWKGSLTDLLASAKFGCLLCQLLEKHFQLSPDSFLSHVENTENTTDDIFCYVFGEEWYQPSSDSISYPPLASTSRDIYFCIDPAEGESRVLSLNITVKGIKTLFLELPVLVLEGQLLVIPNFITVY